MTKLSNKRVKHIIKAVSTGKATVKQVSQLYEVSVRRVQQLVAQNKRTGKMPILSKNRRPKTFLNEEQKRLVEEAFLDSRFGARLLRHHIRKKFGVTIPHNKIHAHLKLKGWAKPNEKKQKQRKYCRYERQHSFSLVHLDWHDAEDGKKVLPILDDASRNLLAIGEFSSISTQNALKVLKEAVLRAREYNAFIRELNSDRDTTFLPTHPKALAEDHAFQKALRSYGIKFIPSRRRHPQTNGKNERWFQEYDKHRHRFKTLAEFADWYNNRIHGGLDLSADETPNEAIMRKLQPESLLGLFYQQIERKKT